MPRLAAHWRTLGSFALAAAVALMGAAVAPRPWPAGAATLEVLESGRVIEAVSIEIGSASPRSFDFDDGTLAGAMTLPGGATVTDPLVVDLGLDPAAAADLDRLELRLRLADGRVEPIPIRQRDEAAGTMAAERRPPVGASAVLGLLGAVVVLWVTEAVPLFVTSLAIPVVLVVAGVGTAQVALAPFFHPIIALFFAGFLMAEAMRRAGLDRLAAITMVARAGRSPATLFAALLGVSAFLSMWMSNTAAVAVLLPITLAVTGSVGDEGYKRAAVLGIAYAATIGGVGSAIGTPANPLAIAFLEEFVGRRVSFIEWFAIGLPLVVLLLPVMGLYLWRRMGAVPDPERFHEARRVASSELAAAGHLTRDQVTVLGVFLVVMALWMTQTLHGLETGIVALGGAVTLAALGRVKAEDLGRISWASLLTFGGGLTLGFFLLESGTSDWLATRLGILSAVPGPLAVAAVAAATLGVTTVASNTASAAMLVPLAIPLAALIGVDPVTLVLVVAVSSSIDFALVVGTPPTLLAYSTRLFTPGQIFRVGIVLDVLGVVTLVTAVVWLWTVLGVV